MKSRAKTYDMIGMLGSMHRRIRRNLLLLLHLSSGKRLVEQVIRLVQNVSSLFVYSTISRERNVR